MPSWKHINAEKIWKNSEKGTVVLAYKKALELGGLVTGPKKLGVFGASYIYSVFVEIGVYGKQHSTERI